MGVKLAISGWAYDSNLISHCLAEKLPRRLHCRAWDTLGWCGHYSLSNRLQGNEKGAYLCPGTGSARKI